MSERSSLKHPEILALATGVVIVGTMLVVLITGLMRLMEVGPSERPDTVWFSLFSANYSFGVFYFLYETLRCPKQIFRKLAVITLSLLFNSGIILLGIVISLLLIDPRSEIFDSLR